MCLCLGRGPSTFLPVLRSGIEAAHTSLCEQCLFSAERLSTAAGYVPFLVYRAGASLFTWPLTHVSSLWAFSVIPSTVTLMLIPQTERWLLLKAAPGMLSALCLQGCICCLGIWVGLTLLQQYIQKCIG